MELSDGIALLALAIAGASFYFAYRAPVRQSQRQLHDQIRQQTELIEQVLTKAATAAQGGQPQRDAALKDGLDALQRWAPRLKDKSLRLCVPVLDEAGREVDQNWGFLEQTRSEADQADETLRELTAKGIETGLARDELRSATGDVRSDSVNLALATERAKSALMAMQARLTRLEQRP